jgi:ADP-heptose:LPS heptosyltransferase
VLAWQGQVGTYCALIENSDEYIGYDSGGQHIAAALGTPTIDIFAHSPYPRFMQRWRPYGPGSVCVIDATQSGRAQLHDLDSTIEQILDCHRAKRRDV